MIRWIRDARIRAEPGGTANVGNRGGFFNARGYFRVSARRIWVESNLPKGLPETVLRRAVALRSPFLLLKLAILSLRH